MARFKPFLITLASVVIFYLSLPPVNLAYLCFIPPIFWVFLIRGEFHSCHPQKTIPSGRLAKLKARLSAFFRSFYGQIFVAELLFWGLSISWLPSPHPAIWAGWAPLSMLMAFYFLIYIETARRFVRRWHMPLILASPLAWVGMEWLRKHILTGFTFCSLEQALYLRPVMIQTAAWGGDYFVGALILLIGTAWGIGIESLTSDPRHWKKSVFSLTGGFLLLGGMVGYGFYAVNKIDRLCTESRSGPKPPIKIALLQDSTYYHFPIPTETNQQIHLHYTALSEEAAKTKPDLIVWPREPMPILTLSLNREQKFPPLRGCPP